MNWKMMLGMFCAGACGGMLPTLANQASIYVNHPDTPLPTVGLFLGIGLWAIVGGVVAFLNDKPEIRQAIFAGIAAPAILTNVVSGATENQAMRRKTAEIFPHVTALVVAVVGTTIIPGPAYSQTANDPAASSSAPPAASHQNGGMNSSNTSLRPTQSPSDLSEHPPGPSDKPTSSVATDDMKSLGQMGIQWYQDGSVLSKFPPQFNMKTDAVVFIKPEVKGGVPLDFSLPVTAEVKRGDNTVQTIELGTITGLDHAYAFVLPPGSEGVSVAGTKVPVQGQNTVIGLRIKTKPSALNDFVWALGAPRNYSIDQINILRQ
jgi:hypothetical protein